MGTYKLILCMCVFITLSQGSKNTYFKTVDITYVTTGVKDGAVCLDGSPPAYHIDRGEDGDKWLVFLEGGAWCTTTEQCINRSMMDLGSSKFMHPINFTSILSDNHHLNPYFYKWNRVYIRYCDGASFTGNRYDPVHKLYYKGAKVLSYVVKELLEKGMSNATNVLLHGCSAGGTAAILNCDKFRSALPTHTRVRCASDAGYFINAKDIFGRYYFTKTYFEAVVNLHGSTENLPKACTSTMKLQSLCFYPEYALPHIKTPVFIINSAFDDYQIPHVLAPPTDNLPQSWEGCRIDPRNCSTDQIKILQGFRSTFLHKLPPVGNGSCRGVFITSCFIHCRYDVNSWSPEYMSEQKEYNKALWSWTTGSPYLYEDDTDTPQICK